jgi:hypothetical protein
MNSAPSFTLRQTLEAMPNIFDPGAWPGLKATVQFNIGGAEPGVYHLQIANDTCVFHPGAVAKPSLSITAPSDIWLGIAQGRISGPEALMKGLYSAQGDFGLLQKWGALFRRGGGAHVQPSAAQRPAGPIAWSGPTWMTAAFVPWIIYWITFGSFGLSPMVSIELPLALSAAIVVYRLRYNRPGWLEVGGLAFLSLGALLTVLKVSAFATWGSVWSNLFMGALWLASLVAGNEPLCMQYVKWKFDRQLWNVSLFKTINAVISVAWGWQAILAANLGGIGLLLPGMSVTFTILRYLTLVPATAFTNWYPKVGMQKSPKDTGLALGRLRLIVLASLVVVAAELAFTLLVRF